VQTSYTFSKVIDSRPDFTSVVVGTDDSKNAQDTLTPNLERGRGNADITHRFVFSGVWDINYGKSLQNPIARNLLRGYQFSLIANVQSGRPLTATVGAILIPVPTYSQRISGLLATSRSTATARRCD
jgi:hypothetical protein